MSTYVMIPGAGGAGWYWHRVVPLLEAAGHQAIAVDLPAPDPATGLPEYTDVTVAAAQGRDDIVLVAGSLGGFTAPLAAQRLPLRALVLVNAMIPVPGETPGQWGDAVGSAQAQREAAEKGGYGTDFDLDVYFMHDVPAEVAASGEQFDEAGAIWDSPCDFTTWPDVPIHVVTGRGDRLFPAEFQRRVAQDRLGIEADLLPGGHLIALAEPGSLADYLLAV
ncbi:MAG TPA: alpha/beta fold hydrolase [Streptosporangiaceae bacterium]|nr:alpha/beta fold hydrolase [Streptosporangiaceae bacterium]